VALPRSVTSAPAPHVSRGTPRAFPRHRDIQSRRCGPGRNRGHAVLRWEGVAKVGLAARLGDRWPSSDLGRLLALGAAVGWQEAHGPRSGIACAAFGSLLPPRKDRGRVYAWWCGREGDRAAAIGDFAAKAAIGRSTSLSRTTQVDPLRSWGIRGRGSCSDALNWQY